jgi:hypothetical protein
MKKRGHRSPYSSTDHAPQQSHGAVDETRAMFERMKGEVIRHTAREREDARARPPVGRLLLVLTIATCLLAAAAMLYGVYKFPDAPIRQTDAGYVGRGGEPHTQEDFEAFIRWRKVMFVIIPSAFVCGFAFGVTDSRQRRKRTSIEVR